MRQTRLDLGVDVRLDLGPLFRFCRGVVWDLGTEVAWVDCWDDAPGGDGVKVIYYCLYQYLPELEELGIGYCRQWRHGKPCGIARCPFCTPVELSQTLQNQGSI